MRIDYANANADFQSYLRLEWQPERAKRRSDHYSNTIWYTAVLLLGVYAAYTSDCFWLPFSSCFLCSIGNRLGRFHKPGKGKSTSQPPCNLKLKIRWN